MTTLSPTISNSLTTTELLVSSEMSLPPKPLSINNKILIEQSGINYGNNNNIINNEGNNTQKKENSERSSSINSFNVRSPIISLIKEKEELGNNINKLSQSYDQKQLLILNKMRRQSISSNSKNVLGHSNSFPNTASPSLLSSPMSTPGTQRRLQPSGIKLPVPPASLLNGLPRGAVMAAAARRIGSGAQKNNLINGNTANVLPSAAKSDHLRECVQLPEAAAQMLMRQRAEELLAVNENYNFRSTKNGLASRGKLQCRGGVVVPTLQMPKEYNNNNNEDNNNNYINNNNIEKPLATIADEEMPQMKIVESTLKVEKPLPIPLQNDDNSQIDNNNNNNLKTSQQQNQIIPINSQTNIKTSPFIQQLQSYNNKIPPIINNSLIQKDEGIINSGGAMRRSISSAAVPYIQAIIPPPLSPKGQKNVNMLPSIDEPTKKSRNTIISTSLSNSTNGSNNLFRNNNNKYFRKKWLLRGALITTGIIGVLTIILVIILTSLPSSSENNKIITTLSSSSSIITTTTNLPLSTTIGGPVNIVGGAIFSPISIQNHTK